MALSVFSNVAKWAGQILSPASNTSPTGTEYAPAVRNINRKSTTVITGAVPASTTYYSPWIDTNQTGDAFVTATLYNPSNSSSYGGFNFQQTDDTGNPNLSGANNNTGGTGAYSYASQQVTISHFITARYWRVTFTNAGALAGPFELTFTSSPYASAVCGVNQVGAQGGRSVPITAVPQGGGVNSPWTALATMPAVLGSTSPVDGISGDNTIAAGMGSGGPIIIYNAVLPYIYNGTSGSANSGSFDRLRTPSIFRGGEIAGSTAGAQVIWQPQVSNKVRLMRYMIEAGEDCTISSAGPVHLGFAFGPGIVTANTQGINNLTAYTHRLYLPSSALTNSFAGYVSPWVELGNGIISTAANQPLYIGMNVPAPASTNYNPTWTITSEQWEAITVGFKTSNSTGNFKLVQQTNNVAAATTVSVTPSTVPGSTVILIVHSTNSATGTPVFSVSANTAGDTYTATTAQTNSSDGAHGGTLGILYATNSAGANTNTITVSATNSPTELSVIYLEYQGMGTGGIDTAAVGTTGSSTSPASGNWETTTAGDLIISCFGTCANVAAVPVMSTAGFFVRGAIFNATQGSLAVCDNFGNGALSAGAISVIVTGTEG